MTCYDQIKQTYQKLKNTYGLYYFDTKTDIKSFLKDVDILSEYFSFLSLRQDESYAIYLPNCLQSFATFYALNKIGIVANIIHPLTPIETLKEIVEQSNTKGIIMLDILICDKIEKINELGVPIILARNSHYIHGIKKVFFKIYEFFKTKNLKKIKNKVTYKNILKQFSKSHNIINQEIENERVAVHIHSGGTTGEIKTIKLSNQAIINLSNQLFSVSDTRVGNDFAPIILPMFHAYGFVANMHTALVQGYNGVVLPKFKAKLINRAIKRYNITQIISVPLMISKMMKEKNFYGKHLQKLQTVYCGGDTVSEILQKQFNDAVEKWGGKAKLLAGYGLTETCSVASVNTMKDYKFGSVGKALQNNIIEIWDEFKNPLEIKQVGEIVISGPTIMSGYLNCLNSGITNKNGKKWIATGDFGYLDSEGFLFVVGRKKRLIKIASFNVFPSQIEELVLKLPFVEDACAFEKINNNKRIIKLAISLKETHKTDCDVIDQLKNHCNKNLIKYAIPTEIVVLEQLPRTQMGKIDYLKITKIYG